VRAFLAGGVPEVMLHLRALGLLHLDALTVSGEQLGTVLEWWERSERRARLRDLLVERDGVDPDDVIMAPDKARERGLTSTVAFPIGNLAPEGSVVKSTSIDPRVVDADGVYRKLGRARVFTRERDAIRAIKSHGPERVQAGEIVVLICGGPLGTGMEEIAQITSALKYLSWGREVAVLTDARFSGFSTGACIGHIGPEALQDGPIGRVQDDDVIDIVIDRRTLSASVNLVGTASRALDAAQAETLLRGRTSHPGLKAHEKLPDDTRLWAALQRASGGTWGGCVYDVDAILARLAGRSN
jgi:dihydroxyacid dehydratase/phosphogluconate dehydratase